MEPFNQDTGQFEADMLSLSLKRSEFLTKNDSTSANLLFDKLEAMRTEMRSWRPEIRSEILKAVIERTEDANTRVLLASWLLPLDETFSLDVLQQICDDSTAGLVGFTAEMTIKEWRGGRMDRYR